MKVAKMVQRKNASNNEEGKSGIFKFLEEENKKWRAHYDNHVKAGRPAKNAQVYHLVTILVTLLYLPHIFSSKQHSEFQFCL